jgi:two-component system chemotaxis sensor kinase CheA
VEGDEQHLREKAKLLLQRERELFDLRVKHEQIAVWLSLGQALPQLFLDGARSLPEICDRVRKALTTKLRLQRVLLFEARAESLQPVAPAGAERALAPAVRALLDARPHGLCNDPGDSKNDPAVSLLAETTGLHRFMWSSMCPAPGAMLLMAAGFDRSKAGFQSPLGDHDSAHFESTARQIESLLKNALLVAELERERDRLGAANLTLERRDQELQLAAEQLRAANEMLEHRVRERTQELAGRNRDLRLVLDNVDQALLTIDLHGRLAPERSRVVDLWFNSARETPLFFAELVAEDRQFADRFQLFLEALREDHLPRDVCISQLPPQLVISGRQFQCRYLPVVEDGNLLALLLVIDDVTERLAREREDREQRELLAAFSALMRDRNGFFTFFQESEEIVAALSRPGVDPLEQRRLLHTLKGNAASVGLQLIADSCHGAESELIEDSAMKPGTLEGLRSRWAAVARALGTAVPAGLVRSLEISDGELQSLSEQASAGASAGQIVSELRRLRWESVELPLSRLAQRAQALAVRLGKQRPEVEVITDGIRLDPQRWAPLWSALIHLVRNAVDHGLEFGEQRREAGKSPAGRLRFAARRVQAGFRLELEDDGRGIDWAKVRRVCEGRGLPSTTRADLLAAILSVDFSTREQVTETSGRGVGLAALHTIVRELGGAISVESEPGAGARWALTFSAEAD